MAISAYQPYAIHIGFSPILFIIALVATTLRLLIMIFYARRRIGLDDVFPLLGVAFLTWAVALLHVAFGDIYLVEALFRRCSTRSGRS
jgi:hypothetical protein